MSPKVSQITSLTVVYSIVYSGVDQRKHQSSASLAFVWGIHRWPVNSSHQGPVTRKMFPFDDVIMEQRMHWNVSSDSTAQCKKYRKNSYRSDVQVSFELSSKTLFLREILIPLSKAIYGNFCGSGLHSKRNCLQDLANFHRSQACQIVLICLHCLM